MVQRRRAFDFSFRGKTKNYGPICAHFPDFDDRHDATAYV